MYPPHLTYLNVPNTAWFNPCYGVFGFQKELQRLKELHGSTVDVWRHRDIKRSKEIYATAIAAMGFAHQTTPKTTWWIHKPIQDPPDGVIGTIVKRGDIQEMHVREVEVVENFDGNVENTILVKLKQKQYEPNTVLVCLLSTMGILDLKSLSTKIINQHTNLEHIFVAAHGREVSSIPKNATEAEIIRALFALTIVQLKPTFASVTVDLLTACEEWKQGKEGNFFIFEKRGRGTENRSVTLDNPPTLF
ncbi:MAG: hypothetical protein WAZ27_01845 [Minisyncoccia bacterium]